MIFGLGALWLRQPPDRIGTYRVGRDLYIFTSIEALQPEVESVEATQELAELLPGIFAPVYDDYRRAFAFIDPSIYRRALRIEPILTGRSAREIGGTQIPYGDTQLNLPEQFGIGFSDWCLRRLKNGKLIATRTVVHAFERPDA
jgi:hypothetical protein